MWTAVHVVSKTTSIAYKGNYFICGQKFKCFAILQHQKLFSYEKLNH